MSGVYNSLKCFVVPSRVHILRYKATIVRHIDHKKHSQVTYYHRKSGEAPLIKYMLFSSLFDADTQKTIIRDMIVIEDFLLEYEEKSLHAEIEPYMRRLRYEFDHWDNAIHGYRETERQHWNHMNTNILERVRHRVFKPGMPQLSLVHVLDLAEEGFIKPHIDSDRFCGNTIAGLSLLSDSVMRLVHAEYKENTVDILLKRRSLYIMKDVARFDFTHEILGGTNSRFGDLYVPKKRRISVICRNEPNGTVKH